MLLYKGVRGKGGERGDGYSIFFSIIEGGRGIMQHRSHEVLGVT